MSGVLVVILPPLIPIALNKIVFHTEKLPYIYIFNGEFLVDDRDSHYWQIYFCDVMLMLFILMIVMGVDSMYIVCIEHCIGVFTVIKYEIYNEYYLSYNLFIAELKFQYKLVLRN